MLFRFLAPPALALFAFAVPAATLASAADRDDFTISVVGDGTASARPDMAVITAGVVTQAATAREALDGNSQATAKVIALFKAEGIDAKDIQTSDFSLQPVYVFPQNGEQTPPRITGYTVSNNVAVRIRDLGKLGSVMDKAVGAGANAVNGIQFRVSRQSELLDEARKAAVADARRKAEIYATAAGRKLGQVTRIVEGSSREAPVPMAAFAKRAGDSAPVPIEAGESQLHVEVNVTFQAD